MLQWLLSGADNGRRCGGAGSSAVGRRDAERGLAVGAIVLLSAELWRG
jgi:hypothetical protein